MLENINDFISLAVIIFIILFMVSFAFRYSHKPNHKSAIDRIEEEYYREFDDIEDEDIDY